MTEETTGGLEEAVNGPRRWAGVGAEQLEGRLDFGEPLSPAGTDVSGTEGDDGFEIRIGVVLGAKILDFAASSEGRSTEVELSGLVEGDHPDPVGDSIEKARSGDAVL